MVKNIIIFTDGSSTVFKDKNNLKYGGVGVFFSKYSKYNLSKQMVGENVTNQVCELQACIDAILIYEKMKEKNKKIKQWKILIYSDSMYTIKSATEWAKKWEKNDWRKGNNKKISNLELIKKLYKLTNKYSVKYIHVRSHQKEPSNKKSSDWKLWNGNNMADKLANDAMKKSKKNFSK
jgi:ribonuclease HI